MPFQYSRENALRSAVGDYGGYPVMQWAVEPELQSVGGATERRPLCWLVRRLRKSTITPSGGLKRFPIITIKRAWGDTIAPDALPATGPGRGECRISGGHRNDRATDAKVGDESGTLLGIERRARSLPASERSGSWHIHPVVLGAILHTKIGLLSSRYGLSLFTEPTCCGR